jgi:hypothetical protein
MLQGAYTWSHAFNMTDDDGWAAVSWNYLPAFRRNYASAGYDRRHVFQMGWVYDLPMGKGKQFLSNGIPAHILGGWNVSGVFMAVTGTPFTIGGSGGTLNTPGSPQTADQFNTVVTKLGQVGPGTRYYDISAFSDVVVPAGTYRMGTTGRNTLRNPGRWNADVSIARTFAIKEKMTLSFRGEMFNFFNHGQFTGFASNSVTSPNFLRVLSATNERQVRFGLRFGF